MPLGSMKKYIILSVNDNPEYLFYTPLTVWAWRKLGWEPVIFYYGYGSLLMQLAINTGNVFSSDLSLLSNHSGYESETITQISRLYGSCVVDGYIMTGDIDMIPLSDYWKPDFTKLSVYGHDLTGFGHHPICYIGAPAAIWNKVMHIDTTDYNALIKRDLDKLPQAKSHDRVKRWVTDQDLITERINKSGIPVDHYHRGTYQNGYARGRVDRSAWTLKHDQLIDCHMLRGIYKDQKAFNLTMDLLLKVWPNEDWQWFVVYTNEFKKLCQR